MDTQANIQLDDKTKCEEMYIHYTHALSNTWVDDYNHRIKLNRLLAVAVERMSIDTLSTLADSCLEYALMFRSLGHVSIGFTLLDVMFDIDNVISGLLQP